MTARWRQDPPGDAARKAPRSLSPAARRAEQDRAAGGRAERIFAQVDERPATASIALRVYPKGRRVYAYLRWSDHGRTRERYIGEVTAHNRAENLTQAWRLVAERGLANLVSELVRSSQDA